MACWIALLPLVHILVVSLDGNVMLVVPFVGYVLVYTVSAYSFEPCKYQELAWSC